MTLLSLPGPLFIQQAPHDLWNKNWCVGQACYLLWYDTPLTRRQKRHVQKMLCCIEGVNRVKADNKWRKSFLISVGQEYFPEMVRDKIVMLFEPTLRYEGTCKAQQKPYIPGHSAIFELTLKIDNLLDEATWTHMLTQLRNLLQSKCVVRNADTIIFCAYIRTEIEAHFVLSALAHHINLHLRNIEPSIPIGASNV